ncbi:MAG: methyltransferase domain-containing protein [Erythrobacter sp.]|jgi:predicted TPR repeat methyltransferase|nr:methyltransferase domain-containing protein [Erythrobacter sp.]
MASSDLTNIYTASGEREMRDAYDAWAARYDEDVVSQGYITPARVARALARFVGPDAPAVLDYGCGTGLSGEALRQVGFDTIDGADLSRKMLDIAQARGVYRELRLVEPEAPLAPELGQYKAIAAAGVISKGAAPASLYREMLEAVQPGTKLAFSINDLSMADPDYAGLVEQSIDAGKVALLFEEHGDHLPQYADNAGSTVYVVDRLG